MVLSANRLTAAIAALLLLGCSAVSACNPGDRVCQGGHLYICKCWCGDPCCYELAGVCHHDDLGGSDVTNFDLLISKYIRQARLVLYWSKCIKRR